MNIDELCECFKAFATPSVQDMLQRIYHTQVCTQTQCFESAEEADFGMLPPPVQADALFLLFLSSLFVIMASMFTFHGGSAVIGKPQAH